MFSHDQSSSPVLLAQKQVSTGGSCDTCTYWLGSHGCCRSDCEHFRSMLPVDSCRSWKPLTATAAGLSHVTFSRSPWAEPDRRIA